MCDAQEPFVKVEALGFDRVMMTAWGTRNQIREVLGAPDSTMDLISELTQAIIFALNTGKLTTGEQAVLMTALINAGVEIPEPRDAKATLW